MATRSTSKTVTFTHPFALKGIERTFPAGDYRVVTDEELIEPLSFTAYHRLATMIFVPADSRRPSAVEMLTVDPDDLAEAQRRDAAMPHAAGVPVQPRPEMGRQRD